MVQELAYLMRAGEPDAMDRMVGFAFGGLAIQLIQQKNTGRMVALKSSGIWKALGEGAGGYTDTLHNAYDPLAFNTGYRQREVNREDAEALGLLEKNAPAQPAKVDFSQLISMKEAA